MALTSFQALAGVALLVFGAARVAIASDRLEMDFFSVVPPAGWHSETDGKHRLLASKDARGGAPFLIIEACKTGSAKPCPAGCDLSAIERSGFVEGMGVSFARVESAGGHVEYLGASEDVLPQGTGYTSIRLLCSLSGFVYAALQNTKSAQSAHEELQQLVRTIHWNKAKQF